jgi:hypothetical protein
VHPLEADRPRAVDSGLTPRERLQGAGPVPAGPALLCPVRSHIRRAPGPRSHICAHIRTNRVIGSRLTSSASRLPNIRCSATRSRFCRITKAIRAAAGWGVEPRGSAASVPAEPAEAERRKRMYTLHARSCRAQTVRACTGGNEQGPNGPVRSAPNNERPKHDGARKRNADGARLRLAELAQRVDGHRVLAAGDKFVEAHAERARVQIVDLEVPRVRCERLDERHESFGHRTTKLEPLPTEEPASNQTRKTNAQTCSSTPTACKHKPSHGRRLGGHPAGSLLQHPWTSGAYAQTLMPRLIEPLTRLLLCQQASIAVSLTALMRQCYGYPHYERC